MKDIRRRFHNLKSNQDDERILNRPKSNKYQEDSKYKEDISERVERYENRDFNDIEYTKSGKPIMKASSHFDLAKGKENKSKRTRDSYDILKRSEFFNKNRKSFNDEDLKVYHSARKRKGKRWKRVIYFIIFLAILCVLALSFILNKGVLIVNPKYKDVNVQGTFIIFRDDFITDTASSTMTKNILKSEPREIDRRATGELTIYNNYSDKPQILIKNTRFQSADGKIFKIGDSVTVPGKIGNNPGSIKVMVSADAYGADYNIPAGTFTIPGLKNNPRYNYFYAKSDKAMSGGMSGVVQAVSESDIDQALADLSPKIEDELKAKAKSILHDDYYVLNNSPLISISNNSEDLASSLGNTFSINGLASIFSVKQSVLAKLIAEQTLGDSYDSDQGVKLDNLNNLQIEIATDTEANPSLLKINVIGKVRIIWTYNEAQLKRDLQGQKLSALSDIIDKYNSIILNARGLIKPFWLNSFPKNLNKISILEEIK